MSVSGNGSYSQGSSDIRFAQPFQSISPVRSTSYNCFSFSFLVLSFRNWIECEYYLRKSRFISSRWIVFFVLACEYFCNSKGFDPLCYFRIRSCMVTRSLFVYESCCKVCSFHHFFYWFERMVSIFSGRYLQRCINVWKQPEKERTGGRWSIFNPFF